MRIVHLGAPSLAVLLLVGCASIPDNKLAAPDMTRLRYSTETTRDPIQQLVGVLRLDVALAAAQNANADLTAASMKVKAAKAAVRQAGVLPNPAISTEFEEFGGSGDLSGSDAMESSIGLSQEILLGGKRKRRIQLAGKELEIAKLELIAKQLHLDIQVRKAFLEVYAAQERRTLAKAGLQLVTKNYEAVAKRIKAGDLSPVQLNKARVELAAAKAAGTRIKRELRIARRQLVTLWGAETARFSKVSASGLETSAVPELPALRKSLDSHPRVGLLRAEMAKQKAGVDLSKAEAWPDLEVETGVSRFNETDDTAFSLGFSIPIPLFNRNQGGIEEAKENLKRGNSKRKLALLEMRRDLDVTYQQLVAANAELATVENEIIPAAEKSHQAVLRAFEAGEEEFLEVLDSQRTLLEARQTQLDLMIGSKQLAIELAGLAGTQFTRPKKSKK